jgi:tRNA(Ile2) C34 agmatinyltransferase TiaS
MSTALLEAPLSPFGEARRLRRADGSEMTLEMLLERTVRSVRTEGAAECPVCRGRMHPDNGAARCSGCGSTLS